MKSASGAGAVALDVVIHSLAVIIRASGMIQYTSCVANVRGVHSFPQGERERTARLVTG